MAAEFEFEFHDLELDGIDVPINQKTSGYKLPSCIEIALHASNKGDFQKARQLFKIAIKQMSSDKENLSQIISLTINIADTYLNEKKLEFAKQWYAKALQATEKLPNRTLLQLATLMIRFAQIGILQDNLVEFKQCFEHVQRVYLLSQEADTSVLLDPLIDLSWITCIKGHASEAHTINGLILQIQRLQEEEKLLGIFESPHSNNLSA